MNATRASEHAPQMTSGIIDTIQSLIVAFVFAMAFRGFILEGFVIPTGSMAPTLMGAHVRLRSPVTGYEYAADSAELIMAAMSKMQGPRPIFDPMITRQLPVQMIPNEELATESRMGDRVLVLKYLFPFTAPKRWDVVVFKNPTDPVGDAVYYIKRLVGMPDETLLISDGDIFTGPISASADEMRIQRKPEYIQRAVWQQVYDSDFQPTDIPRLESVLRRSWAGAPWTASEGWKIRGERAWTWDKKTSASLTWSNDVLALDDWNAYNIYRREIALFPTADLSIAAALDVSDANDFHTTLNLTARGMLYQFDLGMNGRVTVAITSCDSACCTERTTWPFAKSN